MRMPFSLSGSLRIEFSSNSFGYSTLGPPAGNRTIRNLNNWLDQSGVSPFGSSCPRNMKQRGLTHLIPMVCGPATPFAGNEDVSGRSRCPTMPPIQARSHLKSVRSLNHDANGASSFELGKQLGNGFMSVLGEVHLRSYR